MDLNKKKYTNREVCDMLKAYKTEYESRFFEMRTRITDLLNENSLLKTELESSLGKDELILAVLKRAEQTAIDLEKQSRIEYELEFERLKAFTQKWNSYFEKLKVKYPTSTNVKKAIKIKEKVKELSCSEVDAKTACSEIEKMIDGDKGIKQNSHKVFNPKAKMADYINSTEQNGFNLDEVLNPGELELEDLCKELGLIGEE